MTGILLQAVRIRQMDDTYFLTCKTSGMMAHQEFEIPLSKEAYLEILIHSLERLSPETVIHRLTGDGARNLLLAPLWSLNKRDVLNSLHHEMKIRQTFQGRLKEGGAQA